MKNSFIRSLIALSVLFSLLFSGKMYAQNSSSFSGETCTSMCGALMGRVTFAYAGSDVEPTSWSVDKISFEGFSTQQKVILAEPLRKGYSGTNDFIGNNIYTILRNPSVLVGGADSVNIGILQDIDTKGLFLFKSNAEQAFTYRIAGLASASDVNSAEEQKYCIRIKMRNVGTFLVDDEDWCAGFGNNIGVTVRGVSIDGSNGDYGDKNDYLDGTGKYHVVNDYCDNTNGSWTGKGNINRLLTRYGDYAVLEATVQVGQNNRTQDDGFEIIIKPLDIQHNALLAIEEIEVYGCIPQHLIAHPAGVTESNGNVFCENTMVTLKAHNIAAPETELKWYKNNETAPFTKGIDLGEIDIEMPIGNKETVSYTVTGNWGHKTITLISKLCCDNTNVKQEIFSETFTNVEWAEDSTYSYAKLPTRDNPTFGISSHYEYASECKKIATGQYAIVEESKHGDLNLWSKPNIKEHTQQTKSDTLKSGMLLVNSSVAKINDYIYSGKLGKLCPGAVYDCSAWYAPAWNSPVGIDLNFQIIDDNGNIIIQESTGEVKTVNSQHGGWYLMNTLFMVSPTADPETVYTIKIVNNSTKGGLHANGNDIMLDDISVKKCQLKIEACMKGDNNEIFREANACDGSFITLTAQPGRDTDLVAIFGHTPWIQWYEADYPEGPWMAVGMPTQYTNETMQLSLSTNEKYYRARVTGTELQHDDDGIDMQNCSNDTYTTTFIVRKKESCNQSNLILFQTNDVEENRSICIGANEEVNIKLSLTNEYGSKATNVKVTNILPKELKFISSNPKTKQYEDGSIEWNVGDLSIADTVNLLIKAKAVSAGGNIINRAFVSSIDTLSYDDYNDILNENMLTENKIPIVQRITEQEDESTRNVYVGEMIKFIVTPVPDKRLQYEWTGDQQTDMADDDSQTLVFTIYDGVCSGMNDFSDISAIWPTVFLQDKENDLAKEFLSSLNYTMTVFNRYGLTLYQAKKGWDGKTYSNEYVEPGNYFYMIEFPNRETRKASIEIVRE